MIAAQPVTHTNRAAALWLAFALAIVAALVYVLIAQGMMAIGDVPQAKEGIGIVYAAAGGYLLGGLLILVRRRWLWIIGAVINALVIIFFFRMYQNRPSVLLSPGGLISKAAQILLEVTLIYLILRWRRSR